MVFPGRQIVSRPDSQPGVHPLPMDGAVQFRTGLQYGYLADADKPLRFYRHPYFVRRSTPYR
jgi:hypothetical protein